MRRAFFGIVSGSSRHRKAKARFGAIELLERRTLLAAISWTGPSGGDWGDPTNWSGHATPSASDDVTIGPNIYISHASSNNNPVHSITSMGSDTLNLSAGGLTIGADSTLDSLSLAGTLDVAPGATVTLSGPTEWTGGTIGGGGTLLNTGTMTLALNTDKQIYTKIENQGTIDDNQGNTRFQNGTVQNDFGGIWDFQNNATEGAIAILSDGGTNAFNNLAGGFVVKSGGATTVTFSSPIPFNNSAGGIVYVAVAGASLYLSGGTSTGGTFYVVPGGLLDLTNGSNATFTGTYSGAYGGEANLGSGTISIGSGGATFNFPTGMFQWTGGVISGGNRLLNTGSMTISGPNEKYIETKIENQGTIIDNQGNTGFENGTVQNDSGAVWDFQNSTDVHMANSGGTNAFNNLAGGIVQKSTAAGNAYFDTTILFNNAAGGTINISVSGGDIYLGGGGTDAGGNFTITAGGLLDLTNGSNPTFTGTYTGSGGGEVNLASGTISIGTGGATFNFPTSMFQWTGGTINGGNILLNTGSMTLTGTADKRLNTELENQGTIIDNQGNTRFTAGTVQNDATGLWDFQNNATDGVVNLITGGGTNAFNNLGTLSKSVAGANAAFNGSVPFNNMVSGSTIGAVNISASNVSLALGGGGADQGGVFTVAAGSTLDLTGGANPVLTGTYTGSGAGTVALASGILMIGPTNATFNFPAGLFLWTGGTINPSGGGGTTLLNAPAGVMTLTAPNNKLLQNGRLENQGTIVDNQGNTSFASGIVQNDSGAIWSFQNSTDVHMATGGGTNAFNNLAGGTVDKLSGAGNAFFDGNVAYSSVGTTEADAASLSVANALPQVTGNTLNAGTWVVIGGATLATPGTITTIGSGATVTLSGPGSNWPAVNSAAHPSVTTVTSDAGQLNLLLGASLNSSSGMSNTGGLTLGTGSGSQSGSVLNLTTAYTQSSTGNLTAQIGGRPSAGEFGSITAASVSLAGTFTGHLANGFSPVPGDQYVLINNTGSNPVSGTFAGLSNGQMFQIDGIDFTINYNAGPNGKDVVLGVPLVVTSAVVNGNNAALAGVQRSMVDSIVYSFSEAVKISGAAATIAVHSGQPGTVPTLTWNAINPNSDGSSAQWAVSFSGAGVVGHSIANGVYDISLNAADVTSDANPAVTVQSRPTDTFFRLFGDINGNGIVNASDNFQFKTALSTYSAAFDYNGDGVVNAADNFQFKNSMSFNFASSGIVYTI